MPQNQAKRGDSASCGRITSLELRLQGAEEKGHIPEELFKDIEATGNAWLIKRARVLWNAQTKERLNKNGEKAREVLEEVRALAGKGFWPDRKVDYIRKLVGRSLDAEIEEARALYRTERERRIKEGKEVRFLVPLSQPYSLWEFRCGLTTGGLSSSKERARPFA